MRNPAGRIHGCADIYTYYQSLYPESKIEYTQFSRILKSYFKGIIKLLLLGWIWNPGSYLSTFRIRKHARSYANPQVDYGATRKLHKERPELDKNILVYFTNQPFWYQFYWHKFACKIPNKTVYRFDVTCGPAGNSRKITQTLLADPFAHLKYLP